MCLWADLNQCQLHSQGKNEWQYEHPTMPNWQLKLQEIIMFHVILILCGKFDIIFCRLSSSSQLESSIPLGDFQLSLPKKSSHLSPSQAVQVVFEVVTSWHCQSWKDLRPNPKTSQNISKTSQNISKTSQKHPKASQKISKLSNATPLSWHTDANHPRSPTGQK